MEYVSYILVIFGILALFLFWVFSSGQIQRSKKTLKRSQAGADLPSKQEQSKVKQLAASHSLNIPTPWGWPGHDGVPVRKNGRLLGTNGADGGQDSLHRFVDLMLSEKQTVENREYLLKKDASMRALLEDRYGQSGKAEAIKYYKVKAPLLRDPSEPIDQLDSFDSNEASEMAERLLTQKERVSMLDSQGLVRERAYLGNVKTPWGW